MFVLTATILAKPGEEETIDLAMREMVKLSQSEPGTLVYVGHRSTEDPREFMFYEQYADEAAFKVHTETPYFQQWVVNTIAPAAETRVRKLYQLVG